MQKALRIVLVTMFLSLAVAARAGVQTRVVEYRDGDVTLQGYLAYDDSIQGKRPGVLIAHQWKGLGEYEKGRAEMLAALGYTVLAVDVYGKGIRPANAAEAGAEAGKYKGHRDVLRQRMRRGLEELLKQETVDATRVGAIGYCFGGMAAIELARDGADLRGVVSFHGALDSPRPEDGKNIKGKVLALHGADDPFVKPADVAAFCAELRQAGVDWELVSYGGAVHSFTEKAAGNDNSKGAAYNEKADRRSWEAMKVFLAEAFQR